MNTSLDLDYWPDYTCDVRNSTSNIKEMIKLFLKEHPKWNWRSVSGLSRDCSCSIKEIENALNELLAKGLVVQHPRMEEMYCWKVRRGQIGGEVEDERELLQNKKDIFSEMQKCLHEANRLINIANNLNEKILTCCEN